MHYFLLAVLPILIWFILSLSVLPDRIALSTAKIWFNFKDPVKLSALLGLGFAILIAVFSDSRFAREGIDGFYANWLTEIIFFAFTVLVIDRLTNWRIRKEERLQLIRQMGSYSNDFALEAVRRARELGILTDGVSLKNANFRKANLVNADLSEANLEGADLSEANLENANLSYTNLQGSNLYKTNLQGANLENANFYRTSLSYVLMQNAKLEKANLSETKIYEAHFENAEMSGAMLRSADIQHTNFTGGRLHRINLNDAYLSMVSLRNTSLAGATVKNAFFQVVDLENADVSHTDFTGTRLKLAHFDGALYTAETKWPTGFDIKSTKATFSEGKASIGLGPPVPIGASSRS